MSEWVLPGILKVEDVPKVDVNVLEMMSRISTGIILGYVNKFIDSAGSSNDPAKVEAADVITNAYDHVNKVNAYLNSEEAKDLADTLCSLQYSDVSAEMPIEQLISYRATILELLAEDKDFVESYKKECLDGQASGMKSAYTIKLDEGNYDAILQEMLEYANCHLVSPETINLIGRIGSNKNLFVNSRAKLNSPTVLRKAIYKKDRLRSILRGLDFLIEKKNSGESPRSWRVI